MVHTQCRSLSGYYSLCTLRAYHIFCELHTFAPRSGAQVVSNSLSLFEFSIHKMKHLSTSWRVLGSASSTSYLGSPQERWPHGGICIIGGRPNALEQLWWHTATYLDSEVIVRTKIQMYIQISSGVGYPHVSLALSLLRRALCSEPPPRIDTPVSQCL